MVIFSILGYPGTRVPGYPGTVMFPNKPPALLLVFCTTRVGGYFSEHHGTRRVPGYPGYAGTTRVPGCCPRAAKCVLKCASERDHPNWKSVEFVPTRVPRVCIPGWVPGYPLAVARRSIGVAGGLAERGKNQKYFTKTFYATQLPCNNPGSKFCCYKRNTDNTIVTGRFIKILNAHAQNFCHTRVPGYPCTRVCIHTPQIIPAYEIIAGHRSSFYQYYDAFLYRTSNGPGIGYLV
eukprot:1950337-Rhodomonas_salina.2